MGDSLQCTLVRAAPRFLRPSLLSRLQSLERIAKLEAMFRQCVACTMRVGGHRYFELCFVNAAVRLGYLLGATPRNNSTVTNVGHEAWRLYRKVSYAPS